TPRTSASEERRLLPRAGGGPSDDEALHIALFLCACCGAAPFVRAKRPIRRAAHCSGGRAAVGSRAVLAGPDAAYEAARGAAANRCRPRGGSVHRRRAVAS